MFGLPTDVVVGAGLLVLVLLMVMIVVARMYRKAGPHEALIVYGMGGTHVYTGRGAIIFPMVQTCKDLSLELMSFDVAPQQNLYIVRARGAHAVADHLRLLDDLLDGKLAPARNHGPAYRRADRQGAGDGRRPHALHVRGRYEQDGT